MKTTATLTTSLAVLLTAALAQSASADSSLVQKWKTGLSGAKLTSYQGSAISNSSSLTVIDFCRDGRYSYYREGSWSTPSGPRRYRYDPETQSSRYTESDPDTRSGGSTNRITGRWDVRPQFGGVALFYVTDQGDQGSFPMYLQNNGRVNIGGLDYAVQQGGAGC